MLANMAASLILSKSKRVNTTLAKAKALRTYVEPLITRSKEDTTHSRRIVFGYLQSKEAVTELFRDVAVKVAQRPGGYTRILKTGFRKGDNADMCIIELVDYNENYLTEKKVKKAKTSTRRGRGGAKKADGKNEPKAEIKDPTTVTAAAEAENTADLTPVDEVSPVAGETPAAGEISPADDTSEEKKEDKAGEDK